MDKQEELSLGVLNKTVVYELEGQMFAIERDGKKQFAASTVTLKAKLDELLSLPTEVARKSRGGRPKGSKNRKPAIPEVEV